MRAAIKIFIVTCFVYVVCINTVVTLKVTHVGT